MSDRALHTVERGDGAAIVGRIIDVLFPDAGDDHRRHLRQRAVLDGQRAQRRRHGPQPRACPRRVRRLHAAAVQDRAADLVIFDPPYITNPSKAGTCQMADRFGAYPSLQAMQASVETGCREAWRVARLGCWSRCRIKSGGALGRDDRVGSAGHRSAAVPAHRRHPQRAEDPRANWTDQLSAYGNGATYLAFRHGSQLHVRRAAPGGIGMTHDTGVIQLRKGAAAVRHGRLPGVLRELRLARTLHRPVDAERAAAAHRAQEAR